MSIVIGVCVFFLVVVLMINVYCYYGIFDVRVLRRLRG